MNILLAGASGVIRRSLVPRLTRAGHDVTGMTGDAASPPPPRGTGVEAQADWDHLRTPESCLGNGRIERFASPGGATFEHRTYGLPERLHLNRWALNGEWTVGQENVMCDRAGGSIAYRFHARDAHQLPRTSGSR